MCVAKALAHTAACQHALQRSTPSCIQTCGINTSTCTPTHRCSDCFFRRCTGCVEGLQRLVGGVVPHGRQPCPCKRRPRPLHGRHGGRKGHQRVQIITPCILSMQRQCACCPDMRCLHKKTHNHVRRSLCRAAAPRLRAPTRHWLQVTAQNLHSALTATWQGYVHIVQAAPPLQGIPVWCAVCPCMQHRSQPRSVRFKPLNATCTKHRGSAGNHAHRLVGSRHLAQRRASFDHIVDLVLCRQRSTRKLPRACKRACRACQCTVSVQPDAEVVHGRGSPLQLCRRGGWGCG